MAVKTGDVPGSGIVDDGIGGTGDDDTISGLTGNDTLSGEAGNDTIYGGTGTDIIDGGIGNDTLHGNEDSDTIKGGSGNDHLLGQEGDDTLEGDDGNDFIDAYGGTDKIYGGAGNDEIFVGVGAYHGPNDPLFGEIWDGGSPGLDVLHLRIGVPSGVHHLDVDLTQTTIKNFDKMTIDDYPFPLSNYTFDIYIKSEPYNQFPVYNSGPPATMFGIFYPSAMKITWHIVDTGEIKLPANLGYGSIFELAGISDLIDASKSSGSTTLDTGKGDDTVIGSPSASLDINFGDGSDTLKGGNGTENANGEAGDDKLNGGGGDDTVDGGLGVDLLTGGAGNDYFRFTTAKDSAKSKGQADHITDFTRKQDLIDLSTIDPPNKKHAFAFIKDKDFHHKAGEVRAEKQGKDTVVTADVDGNGKADFTIVLDGFHKSLSAHDFVL